MAIPYIQSMEEYYFGRIFVKKKSVSMQQHFKQCVWKQRRLKRKCFGISEAELLRFDSINIVSLQ